MIDSTFANDQNCFHHRSLNAHIKQLACDKHQNKSNYLVLATVSFLIRTLLLLQGEEDAVDLIGLWLVLQGEFEFFISLGLIPQKILMRILGFLTKLVTMLL